MCICIVDILFKLSNHILGKYPLTLCSMNIVLLYLVNKRKPWGRKRVYNEMFKNNKGGHFKIKMRGARETKTILTYLWSTCFFAMKMRCVWLKAFHEVAKILFGSFLRGPEKWGRESLTKLWRSKDNRSKSWVGPGQ